MGGHLGSNWGHSKGVAWDAVMLLCFREPHSPGGLEQTQTQTLSLAASPVSADAGEPGACGGP